MRENLSFLFHHELNVLRASTVGVQRIISFFPKVFGSTFQPSGLSAPAQSHGRKTEAYLPTGEAWIFSVEKNHLASGGKMPAEM